MIKKLLTEYLTLHQYLDNYIPVDKMIYSTEYKRTLKIEEAILKQYNLSSEPKYLEILYDFIDHKDLKKVISYLSTSQHQFDY